jgi:probable HAF family extracellular repeat protein
MTGLALMALAVSAAGAGRPARAGIAYNLTILGTLPGNSYNSGVAVNASGQVTGYSLPADLTTAEAFLSAPNGGPLKGLGTLPGGDFSESYAVNASGQVAGFSTIAGGADHAFLSGPNGGPLTDLGTLPGDVSSFGEAVNASGQVAGFSRPAVGMTRAFLYSGGQMLDLNDLIAPGSGFTLVNAYGISDNGYITGTGTTADGTWHPFLLTPVPESCGLMLLGTGAVGRLGYRAWRRARTRA